MSALREAHLERAVNSTNVRIIDPPQLPAEVRLAKAAVRWLGSASPELAAQVAARVFGTPRRRARPAWEHEVLARASRRFEIDVDDRRIAAWEWGEAGPRVLIVHGWEGRATQLGAIAAPLAEMGFRVVGFDAPAHGESGGATTHFVDFARTLEAIADHVGPLHAVIGHSMGGAVMGYVARQRALAGRPPIAKRYVAIAPPKAVADFARTFEGFLEMTLPVRDAFERRLERTLGVPLASIRSDAGGFPSAPLLVVHDARDREVPFVCGETMARHWPGAVLHRTEGLGHQRILRDRAIVGIVQRFVAWGVTPE